ncbi:MAG TPA: cyclic nucleotide-binding domain-containing protein, partial [Spirochaetia bacterium]|nr:cyclic nucleotide-binding domain-containing protein [Spirochaetia bacterium]
MLLYSSAGDYFTTRQARRLYGYINGGLALGTLISGYIISPLVRWMGTDNLLFVIGGLQILSALWTLFISAASKTTTPVQEISSGTMKAPLRAIFGRPYVIVIIVVAIAGLVCFRLVEFQFQITASRTMREETLAIFFGRFYGYVGIAQVLTQFLLVGWFLGRLGVMGSLSILPIFLIGAGAGFYLHPMVLTAALMNFIRLSLSETLDLPSREVLFLPLPRRVRLRAQALFSGAIVPLGSGLGGVVILILVGHLAEIHYFAPVTAGIVLLWLAGLLILRPLYRKTLTQSVLAIEIGPVDLEQIVSTPGSGIVFDTLFRSSQEGHALLALELLKFRKLGFFIDRVYRLTDSKDEETAVTAFELLANEGARVPAEIFHRGMEDPRPRVRASALLAFAKIWREDAVSQMRAALNDKVPECQLAAMVGLIHSGGFDGALLAYPRLQAMINSRKIDERVNAVKILGRIGGKGYVETIRMLLQDRSREVKREAAVACMELGLPELVPELTQRMSDPYLRQSIIQALESMPPEAGPMLAGFLMDRSLEVEDRSSLAIVFAKIGQSEVIRVLFGLIRDDEPVVLRSAAGRALRIAKERGLLQDLDIGEVYSCLDTYIETLTLVSRAGAVSRAKYLSSSVLFRDRCLLLLEIIFSLLMLTLDRHELKGVEANLLSQDQTLRDNALELLDMILPQRISSRLIPPINEALLESAAAGMELTEDARLALLASDQWLRGVTLYFLTGGKKTAWGKKSGKGATDMSKSDITLLNIINTISFLKTVELFQDVPAEYLIGLAEIVEEVVYFKGETLFKEGERGDSFYLVQEGSVTVKKGRRVLAKLGRGECIGEMALLDGKPRSATGLVEEETKLLRISSDSFSNLLSSHSEMAKALLRTLAQRLRKVTERV